jgi:hypothetical protein
MHYIGIDVSTKESALCILDAAAKVFVQYVRPVAVIAIADAGEHS